MQYLLTQEEYDALRNAGQAEKQQIKDTLQDLCTKVADHMPVMWGWSKNEEAKPWGCILTRNSDWYCDACPVRKVCPYPRKELSK